MVARSLLEESYSGRLQARNRAPLRLSAKRAFCGRRRAYTIIEILLALVLTSIIMMATMSFMRMGQQSVIKTTDHVDARMEAMRILDVLDKDLERLIVGDEIDDPDANVLEPFKRKWDPQQGAFGFYAFHHFEYDPDAKRMMMMGGWIDYSIRKRDKGIGVDLLRNGIAVNRSALHDVKIELLTKEDADKLGVMPQHCVTVTIYPLGQWDQSNKNIFSEANAIKRVFHLRAIESRFACLMSIKRAIESNPETAPSDPKYREIVSKLPTVQPLSNAPPGPPVILAWMQPQMVIYPLRFPRTVMFDDKTADEHKLPPPPTPEASKKQ